MKIEKINTNLPYLQNQINQFLTILTGKEGNISSAQIDALLRNTNTHLFFVFDDDARAVGMITLAIYDLCTGRKAWVEDVVVDNKYQGKGIGRQMMEFIIEFARNEKANTLMLTSRPSRIAANILYQKTGFRQKETNVYQIIL